MSEPVVKFYKDMGKGGNGAFATVTTATDPGEFLRGVSEELPSIVRGPLNGDDQFTFEGLLPQICDLWAKLKGYKADSVFEERLLTVGQPHPDVHMTCLNALMNPFYDPDGLTGDGVVAAGTS